MALVPRYRLVSRILILEIVVRVELINIKRSRLELPFENCLWFRVFQACDYAKYTVTYICMMLCILKYDVNKRNSFKRV